MDSQVLDLCKIMYKGCKSCITECLESYLKSVNNQKANNKTETRPDKQGYYASVKDIVNMCIKIIFPIISIVGCIGMFGLLFNNFNYLLKFKHTYYYNY